MAEVLTVVCCLLVTQRGSVYDYMKFLFLTTASGYATNMKMGAKKCSSEIKLWQNSAQNSTKTEGHVGIVHFLHGFRCLRNQRAIQFTHQPVPSAHCNKGGTSLTFNKECRCAKYP